MAVEKLWLKNGMNVYFNNHEYFFVTEANIKSKKLIEFITRKIIEELGLSVEPNAYDYEFIKDRTYVATLEKYLVHDNVRYCINSFNTKERKYSSSCTSGIFPEDITIIEVTL